MRVTSSKTFINDVTKGGEERNNVTNQKHLEKCVMSTHDQKVVGSNIVSIIDYNGVKVIPEMIPLLILVHSEKKR